MGSMVANRIVKSNRTSYFDISGTEKSSRRTILKTIVSTGLLLKVDPSLSSYGDSANVFGKTTNKSGFLAYAGEGFSLLLPSKWNPSKERDFPDRVSAASVLDIESTTDKKGKTFYRFNILSRTADGDEGGRHQLISATISSNTLYILKVQIGDKRWFKGVRKEAEGVLNSFIVA